MNKIERRYFRAEVRLAGTDAAPVLEGHAAVFNQLSDDMGGWREQIAPGAFAQAIQGDVRALWNHDSNRVLGRTASGTLSLLEDDTGLAFSVKAPDTSWLRDGLVSLKRGDVTGCSFAFWTETDMWEKNGDQQIRTIVKVKELQEVSPGVTFPAYPQTDVALRSLEDWKKTQEAERLREDPAVVSMSLRERELSLRRHSL